MILEHSVKRATGKKVNSYHGSCRDSIQTTSLVLVSLMLRTEQMDNVVRHYLRLERGETDRQTVRQRDRQIDRQTDRQKNLDT